MSKTFSEYIKESVRGPKHDERTEKIMSLKLELAQIESERNALIAKRDELDKKIEMILAERNKNK